MNVISLCFVTRKHCVSSGAALIARLLYGKVMNHMTAISPSVHSQLSLNKFVILSSNCFTFIKNYVKVSIINVLGVRMEAVVFKSYP